MLECLGCKVEANRMRCPETCRALASVPNMIQAFFPFSIRANRYRNMKGPYLGYLRYHLRAAEYPNRILQKIVVNSQDYVWKEGRLFYLDDSWPHSVINHSDEMRAVLIVDVRRPLPFSADIVNRFVTDVVGRYAYGRPVVRKATQFAKEKPLRAASPPEAYRFLNVPGSCGMRRTGLMVFRRIDPAAARLISGKWIERDHSVDREAAGHDVINHQRYELFRHAVALDHATHRPPVLQKWCLKRGFGALACAAKQHAGAARDQYNPLPRGIRKGARTSRPYSERQGP